MFWLVFRYSATAPLLLGREETLGEDACESWSESLYRDLINPLSGFCIKPVVLLLGLNFPTSTN